MINYFSEFVPAINSKVDLLFPLLNSNNLSSGLNFNFGNYLQTLFGTLGGITPFNFGIYQPVQNLQLLVTIPKVPDNKDDSIGLVKWTSSANEGRYNRGHLRTEILNLFEKELGWKHGKEFNLGQEVRPRGVKYGSKTSNHFAGNAVDLTPRGGMTFEKMMAAFLGNSNIRKFFKDNHIGILEETTKEVLAKTRGTGPHFHIGPDKWAVDMWNKRLTNSGYHQALYAKNGGNIQFFKSGGNSIISKIRLRAEEFIDSSNDILNKININSLYKGNDSVKGVEPPTIMLLQNNNQGGGQSTSIMNQFNNLLSGLLNLSIFGLNNSQQPMNSNEPSKQNTTPSVSAKPTGPTVKISGFDVPKDFLNLEWKLEAGTNYGELSEKARKGIVVKDKNGKPDNKRGAKTYGAGLLYHPENGKYMEDVEPNGGYTTEELTRLFNVLMENKLNKAKLVGCKTWNLAAAYSSLAMNFGLNASVVKKLELMIQENKSDDEISNFIAHASDSQRHLYAGLITRRMWEARLWKGDFDKEGSHSLLNKQITKQLNPG